MYSKVQQSKRYQDIGRFEMQCETTEQLRCKVWIILPPLPSLRNYNPVKNTAQQNIQVLTYNA